VSVRNRKKILGRALFQGAGIVCGSPRHEPLRQALVAASIVFRLALSTGKGDEETLGWASILEGLSKIGFAALGLLISEGEAG
jgi:hypothetical protein